MSINHTQLRAFHAVAMAGGYSAASRELGLTQPALTMQVSALERRFGVELFRRAGRGVELTDTGTALVHLTRRYFAIAREAEQYLNDVGELRSGTITLAADGPYHIMPILAAIRAQLPDMKVHVAFGNSSDVVKLLTRYEADLGYSSRTSFDDAIEVLDRTRHEIVLMVPRHHALAGRRRVRLKEIADEDFILREPGSSTRAIFEATLADAGITHHVAVELANQSAVKDAVATGLGIGVVQQSEFGNDSRLTTVRFSDVDLYAEECLICMRERIGTPVIDTLINAVSGNKH